MSLLNFVLRRNPLKVQSFIRPLSTKDNSGDLVLFKDDPQTGIATMTLNRPPVNSLGMNLMQEIISTVDKLESGGYKGVILASSSKSVYSAGLDFKEIFNPSEPRLREFWHVLQEMFYRLYKLKIPSVALINGHAPAGGTLLATCCDYRVMNSNPRFTIGLNEVLFGLPPPFWLSDAFLAVVGQRQAELAVQCGQLFNPQEALAIHLVDRLFDDVTVGEEMSNNFLKKITTSVDSSARHLVKMELRRNVLQRLENEKERDVDLSVKVLMKKETQETLAKYLEALTNKKK